MLLQCEEQKELQKLEETEDSSLESSEEGWLWEHPDLGLLPSRTMRKHACVVLSCGNWSWWPYKTYTYQNLYPFTLYNLEAWGIFRNVCTISKIRSSPPKGTLYLLAITPNFSFPPTPQKESCIHWESLPIFPLLQPLVIYFLSEWNYLIQTFHVHETMCVWICYVLLIYSLVHEHLDCVHIA